MYLVAYRNESSLAVLLMLIPWVTMQALNLVMLAFCGSVSPGGNSLLPREIQLKCLRMLLVLQCLHHVTKHHKSCLVGAA